MTGRKMIAYEVDAFEDIGYQDAEIPLAEAIQQLQRAALEVPEEYRAGALLYIWSDEEDRTLGAVVQWQTPETDEEVAARVAKEMASRESARHYTEQREREQLAMLKAKYEP